MQMEGLPEARLPDRSNHQPVEAAWKVLQATMEAAEERFFFLVRLHRRDSVLKAAFQTLLFNPLTGEVRRTNSSDSAAVRGHSGT